MKLKQIIIKIIKKKVATSVENAPPKNHEIIIIHPLYQLDKMIWFFFCINIVIILSVAIVILADNIHNDCVYVWFYLFWMCGYIKKNWVNCTIQSVAVKMVHNRKHYGKNMVKNFGWDILCMIDVNFLISIPWCWHCDHFNSLKKKDRLMKFTSIAKFICKHENVRE